MPVRALVSSIPKCGKNLIVSFFDALGLGRQLDEHTIVTSAACVQTRWLIDTRSQGLQYQPGITQAAIDAFMVEAQPVFEALLRSFATLPDGSYIHGHFGYDAELHAAARDAGVPIVFVYRDPRAALASLAHFLVDRGEPADLLPRLARRDIPTALRFLLDGDPGSLPFELLLAPYAGWLGAEGVLALRFEDLVGPRGGGSAGRQLAALTALARHVGWDGHSSTLLGAVDQTFNPQAGTFRRGRIDSWRDDLGPWAFEEYPSAVVDLPRAWGYTDEPEPAGLRQVEDGLMATIGAQRAEQAEHQHAFAAAEADHAAQIAQIVVAFDALTADNEQRLALVHKLEDKLATQAAAYEALAADNEQRLALVRELEDKLAKWTAAYHVLAADNDARLALVQNLTSRLTELTSDSDERLAIARDLGSRLAELKATHMTLEAHHAEREAHVRRLETRLADLKTEHDALTIEHDALKLAYDTLTANHAESRAALGTLRKHPVVRLFGPRAST